MSKVVSSRGGLLRRGWGLSEIMKERMNSNINQVLLRLLCLAALIEIFWLIFKNKKVRKIKVEFQR